MLASFKRLTLHHLCCFLAVILVAPAQLAPAGARSVPYNVVVVLVDDLGWTDTSVRMDNSNPDSRSDFYETPNLERFSAQSMKFSQAYSASPICSPARASLLTGVSPQRLHMTDIIGSQPGTSRYSNYYVGRRLVPPPTAKGLPANVLTVAEVLKQQIPNVATAHFGKWHVGAGGPEKHGFDAGDGATGNGSPHGGNAFRGAPDPKGIFSLTERSIDFMTQQVAKGRPFYLQVSHFAVHEPMFATPEAIRKYEGKAPGRKHGNAKYAAMVENVDASFGRLLDAIDRLGIGSSTYVIFTSDNGAAVNLRDAAASNTPLAHGKTWVYEGGIRVPLIVRGPGIIPDSFSNAPVIGWDMLPTICEMMGCRSRLPDAVQGGSIFPVLEGSGVTVRRPLGGFLVWDFPHYLIPRGTLPQVAAREGDFKLVKFYENGRRILFNLATDIGEARDVSAEYPELTTDLDRKLENYMAEVHARRPVRNRSVQQ